jgi:hypothetical protein
MRFNAQIATIENGFVYLPSAVQWLAEFVPEILTFPRLEVRRSGRLNFAGACMAKQPAPQPGIIGYYRREYAISMKNKGDTNEKVSSRVNSTREEVQRWFEEDKESTAPMQAICNRRYMQRWRKMRKRNSAESSAHRCRKRRVSRGLLAQTHVWTIIQERSL